MGNLSRLIIRSLVAVAATTMATGAALADYPDKPIRMIVPFSQGGAMDQLARMVAEPLSKKLGETVIIVNKPGAGGAIGTSEASRAKPDGYTLVIGTESTLVARPLMTESGFTPGSFTPIARLVTIPNYLAVRADSKFKSLGDLVKGAKEGTITWTSPGVGTGPHLSTEIFFSKNDVTARHVASTNGKEALLRLLSGEVNFVAGAASSLPSMVDGNKGEIRPLGMASNERWRFMPNVPTFKEQGFDFEQETWFGIMAPKGVPEQVVTKLESNIEEIVKDPVNDKLLGKFYFIRSFMGSDDLKKEMTRKSEELKPTLEAAGLAKK